MLHKRVAYTIRHAVRRLIPRRFHTSGLRAHMRVEGLTRAQRDRLRQNLRSMLRPETA